MDKGRRVRGWFPRQCVKIIDNSADDKRNQDPVKEEKGIGNSPGGKDVTEPVKKKPRKASEDAGVKRTVRKRETVKSD